MKYQLSPTARFNRIAADRSLQIEVGSGDSRSRLGLEVDDPQAFYRWLLALSVPASAEDVVASAGKTLARVSVLAGNLAGFDHTRWSEPWA